VVENMKIVKCICLPVFCFIRDLYICIFFLLSPLGTALYFDLKNALIVIVFKAAFSEDPRFCMYLTF
jgi:hypothetical protein